MKKNAFTRDNWDPLNSTFGRIIYFQGGKKLTGYSKKAKFPEPRDKIGMLTNWILRDYYHGYLDRNNTTKSQIEFTEIYHLPPNRTDPPVMIRLYYDFPEYGYNYLGWDKELDQWINRFYKLIEEGRSREDIFQALIKNLRGNKQYEDPLRLECGRFKSPGDLSKYCLYLMENNIRTKGEVEQFYKTMLEKCFKK